MKKIFFFILLLIFTIPQYSQINPYFNFINLPSRYDKDARVYFQVTDLSLRQKKRVNTFIKMLKDSLGISRLSDKFDVIYLLANENAASALKNLVKRNHDATAVNNPTFTAYEGFQGNGVSSYINTNYNPYTQGVSYLQNNASAFAYRRIKGLTNVRSMIEVLEPVNSTFTALVLTFTSSDRIYYDINTSIDIYDVGNDIAGLFSNNRSSATSVQLYLNGVDVHNSTSNTSTVLPNGNIFIGAGNLVGTGARRFSTDQISFVAIGSSFSTIEHRKITNCIEWYMDNIGTGVIAEIDYSINGLYTSDGYMLYSSDGNKLITLP